MLHHKRRSPRSLFRVIAAAAFFASPLAFADVDPTSTLDQADALLQDGRLVRAKSLVSDLQPAALSSAQRDRAADLLASIDRRMRSMDVVEISLQRSELALETGDNREAERQASAARRHRASSDEQKARAAVLLEEVAAAKADFAPLIDATLNQAVTDFMNGEYAVAKAGFDSVYRSGVDLSGAQIRTIEKHRTRILEIERERGEVFDIDLVALGALQPGHVDRTTDPLPTRGNTEPQDAPIDLDEVVVIEEVVPAAQDDVVVIQPTDDDLFEQAFRFEAERYLTEADEAFAAGRYAESEQKYALVLGPYRPYLSNDQLARAESRLQESRVLLQGRPPLVQDELRTRQLQREQAVAEFENFIRQSQTALSQGDFARASELAGRARLAVAQRRDVFSESEYNARIADQERLLTNIRNAEEASRVSEIQRQGAEAASQTREAETRQAAEKQRKINESIDRVRELQAEQKYTEALQVVDQILFLDPNNPTGLLIRDVLKDVVIYREWDFSQRDKAWSYAKESNRMQRALIIPDEIISYPSDWPEISFRRGEPVVYDEPPENREVLAALEGKKIPASFSSAPLEDVLEFIAAVGNLNVDVDWDALSNIGINRDTEVTLNLRPVPMRVVLDRVLEKISPDEFSRAGWAVNDGVLVVASDEALRRNTFIRIYDIQDLIFEIPNFTDVPELDLDAVLQQSGGGGGGRGVFRVDDGNDIELTDEERIQQVVDLIQTNIDFEGWQDNGGTTGRVQILNGNLIITNTARNHREVANLLKQLREIREIQINVEARFLEVAQDFFEQIGFDLDVYFNAQNNQYENTVMQEQAFGGTGFNNITGFGDFSSTVPSDLIGTRQTDTTQWFISDIEETTGEITYEFGPLNTSVIAPDGMSIIPVQQGSLNMAENLITSAFASTILAGNPALGVAGTFLDEIQVDFLVQATQADRRNVSLTAPRLTLVNNRYANIAVGVQRAYVSDLQPVVSTSSVGFDPTVSTLNTGVTLLLRGVVSSDRRYVTLSIDTRIAQLVGFQTFTVTAAVAGGGDGAGGSATAEGELALPEITISSIQTAATIPDQGTILLGGQRLVTEQEVESGVPVLSKIPVINRFFSNRIETKEERTLLILMKPTILIQSEEEERNFPGLLDRLGVGY
jgi:type II secretory pathway component GspD/PulD (secretin)